MILAATLLYASVACALTPDKPGPCRDVWSFAAKEAARTLWTTTETAVRGFMLGFGGAILQTLLRADGKTSDVDYHAMFKLARVAGLGSASLLVGSAILVPAQWRYQALTLHE